MSTIGDMVMQGGRPDLGVGVPVAPNELPQPIPVVYASWAGGIDASRAPEELTPDTASYAIDIEVSRASELIRSPGLLLVQDMTPRSLAYIFTQTSLDGMTELVAIDPPYLLYKGTGAMVVANAGIGATGPKGWVSLTVAGQMIFSNGVDLTYLRNPGSNIVTDITVQIVARTFASIFGRIFAGAVTPSGEAFQGLGISWNAASGLITDWTGAGSGSELLIADQSESDKLVALRSVGYDLLAILMRHSVWAGYPTGDSTRPSDFRPRTLTIGCVGEPTARNTPAGVTFLSDEGVFTFSPYSLDCISTEINDLLLPLDYTQLQNYSATFVSNRNRYELRTPTDLWIYEFPAGQISSPTIKGRWLRRSAVVNNVVAVATQLGYLSWNDVTGSWNAQTLNWDSLVGIETDTVDNLFVTVGTKLATEDAATTTYLGTAYTPIWRTPFAVKDAFTEQYATLGFEIEYTSSASSQVMLRVTDSNGLVAGSSVTKTLPSTAGVRSRVNIYATLTGMNATLEISIVSGAPQIARVRQLVLPMGPMIASVP